MPTAVTHMTEADLQDSVIELAHLFGWRVAHFRSVPVKHGSRVVWQTPVQADGAGFPDLVLARHRVLFAELKSASGTLSNSQIVWSHALSQAGAEYHLWTPAEWGDGTIECVLRGRS